MAKGVLKGKKKQVSRKSTPSEKKQKKVIWIASDHAGWELKEALKKLCPEYEWKDLGPFSKESVDYPDYAHKLCEALSQRKFQDVGVLICGSGQGMCMSANKWPGVRAALVWDSLSARLAREHNHAQVMCLGGRFFAPSFAAHLLRVFVETKPSQASRHKRRVRKIEVFHTKKKGSKKGE